MEPLIVIFFDKELTALTVRESTIHSSIPKTLPRALPVVNETKSDFFTGKGYSMAAITFGISTSIGVIFDLIP